MRNIWIVSNRLSRRYVFRGFGFGDLNSSYLLRTRAIIIRAIVIKFVPMGVSAGILHNTNANLPTVVKNLCQCFVEAMLILPLNVCAVCRFWLVTFQATKLDRGISKSETGCCVLDEGKWKIAAADDHNYHD